MGVLNYDFVYRTFQEKIKETHSEHDIPERRVSLFFACCITYRSGQTCPFSWSKISVNYDWESPAYGPTVGKIIKWWEHFLLSYPMGRSCHLG